jgi:hypothetical protein
MIIEGSKRSRIAFGILMTNEYMVFFLALDKIIYILDSGITFLMI